MTSTVICLVEFMDQPSGLTTPDPMFSWAVNDPEEIQTGFRLLISAEENLSTPVWDTGIVQNALQHKINYHGTLLKSGTSYYYQVTVFCKEHTYTSAVSAFTTGLLEPVNWDYTWIGGAGVRNHSYLIRWPFQVVKEVAAAAVFAVSPNYYLLHLDGSFCSDWRLNNAFTDPEKTLLYETYPLSLGIGSHVLGIELGNGWFNMERAERGIAKGEHLFAAILRIEYTDGEVTWLHTSDKDCWLTDQVPCLRNNVYTGETYDARKEQPGWDTTAFQMFPEQGWQPVFWLDGPAGQIKSQQMEPIKIVQELTPQAIYELPDGSYTIDFGQNFAGWVRLRLSGNSGETITMRHAELIYPDYSVNESSLNGSAQVDTYILKGDTFETFEPHFTYHGFRYVQLFGLKQKPAISDIQGCVARTAVSRISQFETDCKLLNQFYQAMIWTEQSNLYSIPTDCPQRAERMAWMNDMTVRTECALYQFRLPAFYRKWLSDIRDGQGKITGAICDTAPYYRMGQKPADPVSSGLLLVSWNLYCFYGSQRILEENYESCKRWVLYLDRNSDNGIVRFSPMGDWASPEKWCDKNSIGTGAVSSITPGRLMSTGFQYYNWCLMIKMADVLGKAEDASLFRQKKQMVKEAFFEQYYQNEEHYFAQNSQASNAFPLYLGMLEDNRQQADLVLANLTQDIVKENQYHLTTGNLCSRYVCEVLFLYGYADIAFRLLTQTDYPSWGYMLENGATTLWERWEKVDSYAGVSKMASYNHPMSGAVGVCFHKYLAGIRPDEASPGFSNCIIRPLPPKDLHHVKASLDTIHGRISNEWSFDPQNAHRFTMNTTIPFGCSATIFVPISWCENNSFQITAHAKDQNLSGEKVSLKEGCFLKYQVASGHCSFCIQMTERSFA